MRFPTYPGGTKDTAQRITPVPTPVCSSAAERLPSFLSRQASGQKGIQSAKGSNVETLDPGAKVKVANGVCTTIERGQKWCMEEFRFL